MAAKLYEHKHSTAPILILVNIIMMRLELNI